MCNTHTHISLNVSFTTGIKCPPPPPLPPNYVCRQQLLDEMVTKLCQSTIDPNSYGTSLTVTGAGGFGKTSIVTALCHHPVIKEQFKDGVVFIELGPQATDPSMKLKGLYNLLSDEQCDVNVIEQQINQLTSHYCRNLLVIIDDVWHVEDAEPIVKAFSNCKIVLTTRMNDIDQDIPTKQVVSVGHMEQSEAIALLTCGVIDVNQLLQKDVTLLVELAQDVHLWPLLLSLIRGHLSHNLKRRNFTRNEAIHNVQAKLHNNGLTAFDRNNIDRSRKYAVKACINVTLQLLTKSVSDKMKSLILWTGIGSSLQTAVLHHLWKVDELEASDIVDKLWTNGLVHFIEITIPPHRNTQTCVEVHAVISQYMMECIKSIDTLLLSPFCGLGTGELVCEELRQQFMRCCGVQSVATLSARNYLTYKLIEIEYSLVPFYLKRINSYAITDPHNVMVILQKIRKDLSTSARNTDFLPLLYEKLESFISDCNKELRNAHKLNRKLNQHVQQCLTHRNYDNLIQTLEKHSLENPVGTIAQKAATRIKEIIPFCDRNVLHKVVTGCEHLLNLTYHYHYITLMSIPITKLQIQQFQNITTSLQAGSYHIELAYNHYRSGKFDKQLEEVVTNYYRKRQEISHNFA